MQDYQDRRSVIPIITAMKKRYSKEEQINLKANQDNIILVIKRTDPKYHGYFTKEVITVDSGTIKKIEKSIKLRRELDYLFDEPHMPELTNLFEGRQFSHVDDLPANIWNAQSVFLSGWATFILYKD